LLPSYARDSFTANESGNALVLTASQTDVRRMVEIVKALDDSISGTSSIRVFPLRYADAKELANAVKELFQPPTQQGQGGNRGGFFNPFLAGAGGFGGGAFGGGAFGGAGGQGGQARRTGGGNGAAATIRVVAVPDEHSNSLIVSAPEDAMPTIEKLVNDLDVAVADITELRVFHLNNADPLEMSDLLSELFPDDSKTGNNANASDFRFNQGGRGGVQGGFRPFGGLGNNQNNQSASSQRNKKMGRVISVPDQRTSSLIVSAAGELMPQIEQMIAQLDQSPAKKQKVFVFSLEHADVQQAEQIIRDMFDRSNQGGNRNSSLQNSPLLNRSQQMNQNQQGTGFGNQGGFGGQGGLNGGQFGR
jgi:type II secretory pathway component GspD/PulD (secretin)